MKYKEVLFDRQELLMIIESLTITIHQTNENNLKSELMILRGKMQTMYDFYIKEKDNEK